MTTHITEQLQQPHRKKLTAIGATAVAAVALILSLSFWNPQQERVQTAQLTTSPLVEDLEEEMSDIDFL